MAAFTVADLPANMQTKIAIDGDCWNWTGSKNPKGYGSVSNGKSKSMLAHRKAYMHTVGEIPRGHQIDHLCENTSCVNPAHLEAVTPQEHRRRIGHADLAPVYRPEPVKHVPDPGLAAFAKSMIESWARRTSLSPEERAAEDAKRHRLHVSTGTRCPCESLGLA